MYLCITFLLIDLCEIIQSFLVPFKATTIWVLVLVLLGCWCGTVGDCRKWAHTAFTWWWNHIYTYTQPSFSGLARKLTRCQIRKNDTTCIITKDRRQNVFAKTFGAPGKWNGSISHGSPTCRSLWDSVLVCEIKIEYFLLYIFSISHNFTNSIHLVEKLKRFCKNKISTVMQDICLHSATKKKEAYIFFFNQTLLNRVSSACEGFAQKICNKLVVTFMRGFFS